MSPPQPFVFFLYFYFSSLSLHLPRLGLMAAFVSLCLILSFHCLTLTSAVFVASTSARPHLVHESSASASKNVMNAAARVIMNLSLRDHVKPGLKQLHWLPVEHRITYKLCLFMYHIHIGQAPQHLSDCVSTASEAGDRYRLRSTGSAAYVLPRTRTRFGECGFFYSGPATWNTLPSDLHYITDTSAFRKRLKNVLFDRAYY